MSGAKVLEGLKDDVAGNFASVTIEGQRWVRADAPSTLESFTADDAWHLLVEKDDRTSPEEYPEMCLITEDELRDYMERAAPPVRSVATTEWQPIETAPKDGSRIQLFHEHCVRHGEGVVHGRWYVHPSVAGWLTDEFDCNDYEFEPTHWKPVDSGPLARNQDQGGGPRS